MVIETVWQFIQDPESVSSITAFIYGFILALLLVLLGLLWSLIRQRRTEQSVTVTSENGDLMLTVNAIKEFVSRVVGDYPEASMGHLKIRSTRGEISLKLSLDVVPGTPIVPLVQRVREQLQHRAGQELGIEEGIRVDVVVKSLSAKERTPGRKKGESTVSEASGGE